MYTLPDLLVKSLQYFYFFLSLPSKDKSDSNDMYNVEKKKISISNKCCSFNPDFFLSVTTKTLHTQKN